MSTQSEIVDFHGHWFPPAVVAATPAVALPPALQRVWPLILDLEAQLDAAAEAGIGLKIVNAVYAGLVPTATVPLAELPARTNDVLAEAQREHSGRLLTLATIDAYRGLAVDAPSRLHLK